MDRYSDSRLEQFDESIYFVMAGTGVRNRRPARLEDQPHRSSTISEAGENDCHQGGISVPRPTPVRKMTFASPALL